MKKIITKINSKLILDSLPDAVIALNNNCEIIAFNKMAEKTFNITSKKAIGRKYKNIIGDGCCDQLDRLNTKEQNAFLPTSKLLDEKGNIVGSIRIFRQFNDTFLEKTNEKILQLPIITQNIEMLNIIKKLPWIANSPSSVLLTGESGTGKELFAQTIHDLSLRSSKPFVAVNCAALPDNLLESELFGYKAGAFTGANKDKPGRFKLADNGTIFLDEIGDMSLSTQAKLLRVLQKQEFEPLGAIKTIKTDARVIAATNKNISSLIENKLFRRDLYYRINIVEISIPPLKERIDDLQELISVFIKRYNTKQKRKVKKISKTAHKFLENYNFPGNVRELENIIEHAVLLCRGNVIEVEHLPSSLQNLTPKSNSKTNTSENISQSQKNTKADNLMKILERNNWNRADAANEIGIHKATLFMRPLCDF